MHYLNDIDLAFICFECAWYCAFQIYIFLENIFIFLFSNIFLFLLENELIELKKNNVVY
jgi:hypothetical protein